MRIMMIEIVITIHNLQPHKSMDVYKTTTNLFFSNSEQPFGLTAQKIVKTEAEAANRICNEKSPVQTQKLYISLSHTYL